MPARLLTILLIGFAAFYSCLAQDTGDAPKKANARPREDAIRTVKAQPFDKADVKTMAEQCVRLETELGNIEIELYPEEAPETVRNFLNLVATGMYDTTTFNRVVPNFVIQGGKLSTRESGVTAEIETRSERLIADEPNKILHQRGGVDGQQRRAEFSLNPVFYSDS